MSNESEKLIFVEPEAMSEESIKKLESKGYIVIKVRDSNKIKFASDIGIISGNVIYHAAIGTLKSYPNSTLISDFGNRVLQSVELSKTEISKL